jgi:CubicO group peptidase (beta-lactamase class C family)
VERRVRQWATPVVVLCALVMGGCTLAVRTPEPSPSPMDRAARSQAALDEVVVQADVEPGCSATVGRRGQVLWQAQRGLAVLQPATPITAETAFDIASVSKQFTALAVALLAEEGRLSLVDTVDDHLDGYPDWAGRVTLSQLVHHTSGIPDIFGLMSLRGTGLERKASRADLLEAIRQVEALDFEPGSQWTYSNSNYLLLGQIVEQTSGRPLGSHLTQTLFAPLGLDLTMDTSGSSPLRTRSYRADAQGQFEVADVEWDLSGASGVWATTVELIRWADVYRTGVVGGKLVTQPQADAAVATPDNSRYGLGIVIAPDGVLWHGGELGGYHTTFLVSADRDHSIAVACNGNGIEPFELADDLRQIWQVG